MSSLAARALRAAAFVRHVPPRRLVRRVWLEAKRRVLAGRAGATSRGNWSAWRLREDLAPPLLPGEPGGIDVRADGFEFRFLGRSLVSGPHIDWSARSGATADQLWRMNLHYMEYLAGVGDNVFADLVEQWIGGNRPYGRGYWRDAWNAYALSIRTTVWMDELARRHVRLAPAFKERMAASLAEQLVFLDRNLETDIGGNHFVKNIRALATGSRVFADPQASVMRKRALLLLEGVLDEQILADGVHYERSPSYHNQVFGDLLAVRYALGDGIPKTLSPRFENALASMAQAAADLAHPDGRVSLFNDAGVNMGRAPQVVADMSARVLGNSPPPRRHFAFREAGYYGFRSAGIYFVADCGRLGPDALMAHAHGDALSFELSVAGERVIVDQGVYEYVAGPRREAARAARSHNTLSIGGLEQADFFGAFRCGIRPDVRATEYVESRDGFMLDGWHDGFARTGNGPIHRRRFVLDGDHLALHDQLDGPVPYAVSTGLLLHPECRAAEEGSVVVITRGAARLRVTATVPYTVEPAVHWPDMGVEEKTVRIVFHWPTGLREATVRLDMNVRAYET